MLSTIVGVDPGLNGAIAFLKSPTELMVYDMPTVKVVRNKIKKRELDYFAIGHMFDNAKGVDALYIERVGAMKAQGVTSVFSFGLSTGVILGAAAAHFWRINKVSPITWKRALGLNKGANKEDSRKLAAKLFPKQAGLFARAKDDGRAEAALIAWFGWLHRNALPLVYPEDGVWQVKSA